jgi:hypothetical protein
MTRPGWCRDRQSSIRLGLILFIPGPPTVGPLPISHGSDPKTGRALRARRALAVSIVVPHRVEESRHRDLVLAMSEQPQGRSRALLPDAIVAQGTSQAAGLSAAVRAPESRVGGWRRVASTTLQESAKARMARTMYSESEGQTSQRRARRGSIGDRYCQSVQGSRC